MDKMRVFIVKCDITENDSEWGWSPHSTADVFRTQNEALENIKKILRNWDEKYPHCESKYDGDVSWFRFEKKHEKSAEIWVHLTDKEI